MEIIAIFEKNEPDPKCDARAGWDLRFFCNESNIRAVGKIMDGLLQKSRRDGVAVVYT
jgi:hypothetical protein